MDEHDLLGRRASTISIALNGALAVVKLTTGLVGQSYALVADAIESLADIFSSFIVWSGLVIAARPADVDHPYGHGKAEPLAALAVALMLVAAAIGIAWQALHEIRVPHSVPAIYTLPVLVGVIVIKEAMYRYEWAVARRIRSSAISVDAWHHRSDALTSAAAAVGISIALLGGPGYAAADDWAALLVCVVVVFNGVRFARFAIVELMDTLPDPTLMESIQKASLEVDGAKFVEKVLIRKMGPRVYVDMHLEVDPSLTVREAHGIAHQVKDVLRTRWPQIADVLVHIEPHGSLHPKGSGSTPCSG